MKFIAAVAAPLHNVWFATALTVAIGFTVIVKIIGALTQLTPPPVKVAITVMVPRIGPLVALVAVNGSISPVPLAARPIAVLVFVQLYTSPGCGLTVPVKNTAVVKAPLHITWFGTWVITGCGLTVIVKVFEGPVQVVPLLVKLGVTVILAT